MEVTKFEKSQFELFLGGEPFPKPSKTKVDFFSVRDPCQDLSEGVADEWFQVAAAARRCLELLPTLSSSAVSAPTRSQQLHTKLTTTTRLKPVPTQPLLRRDTVRVVQQCGTGVVSVAVVVQ